MRWKGWATLYGVCATVTLLNVQWIGGATHKTTGATTIHEPTAIPTQAQVGGEARKLAVKPGASGGQKAVPEYAKWGKLALSMAQQRYPAASIVDYEHLGRTNASEQVSVESFKLWMILNGKESGVIVRIGFFKHTNGVTWVHFEPTDR